MGKSSLILALGMAGIIAFFILRLNANSKENVSTTVDMFEKTQARLIANTGVEVYLEKLYNDPTLLNTTSSWQNLFHGTYNVQLQGTLPNVRVISTAKFEDIQHISIADALLEPLQFPDLAAGIYISSNAVSLATELGDMQVNGLDHDVDGNIKGDGKPAVWGIGVDNGIDQTSVLANLLKPKNVYGLIDPATGDVGESSVGVTNMGIDWAKIYQYLANNADSTIISNPSGGSTFGTLNNPIITLVNAAANNNGSITLNNMSGSGIMIVNGNVKFTGKNNYKGIILCYKNSELTFESTGTNNVLGGIIAAGTVKFKLIGTMNVDYSKDVIDAVRYNLKADGFKIIAWYE
jgi:hypothetical protein